MTFRANEAEDDGFNRAKNYLLRVRDINPLERKRSENKLLDIIDELGPKIDSYPSWHPLVTHHDDRYPVTFPSEQCGYDSLDHTIAFRNGFITCPYHIDNARRVISSVKKLPHNPVAEITAELLDVKFYADIAEPVLVKCNWDEKITRSHKSYNEIPASIAIPLMLEKEIPCWQWAQLGETWETQRLYFLGSPHGSRSSLFVGQETGQTMKKIWNLLINTGMYGPIKVSNQQ